MHLSWCLTSTEARWPIRDGDRVGRGRESEKDIVHPAVACVYTVAAVSYNHVSGAINRSAFEPV